MFETVFTFLMGLMQIAGAVYAFGNDGVLAKMLGLLFCLAAAACFGGSLVFLNDYFKEKEKGGHLK
jgi:drug/metabolite transporter (DMT)-like permease